MSKTRKILLVGFVLVAVVATALLFHHFQSRNALARYKAQLRARGELLTFSELTASYSANVPDSMGIITNAVIKLRQAAFQPGGSGAMEFVAPGMASVAWMEDEAILYGSKTSRVAWIKFSAQLDKVDDSLEKIREAMKDPAPHLGPRTNFLTGVRPNFVALRTAAHWLTAAALNEVRQGHLDKAVENIEALTSLAQMHRDEFTLVNGMIRVAIAGLGESTTWEALQASGWNEPQLERLQKAWESVDLIQALENGFLGERAFGAEIWALIRQTNNSASRQFVGGGSSGSAFENMVRDYVLFPAYKITSMDDDEIFHLSRMQKSVEVVRMLEMRRPWTEVKKQRDKNQDEMEKIFSSTIQSYRHWISSISIPSFTRAMQTAVRKETQRQMTIAAIALKRYELRHAKLPATLDALVPEFLSEPPFDCMSGQPLRYRLNTDGSFLLYSVGDDGKDDGGDPTPAKSGDKPDFWNGRDAVWPAAATNEPVKIPAGK